MKKITSVFLIFLISVLLSGCVSIPLTDGGTIEISADGVQLNIGEDTEKKTEETEAMDANEKEIDKTEGDKIEDNEIEVDFEGEPNEGEDIMGFGGCDNEFYLLESRILDGFPLAPCPEFKTLEINNSDNQRDVYAVYTVFSGIYEEFDLYKEHFIDAGYKLEIDRVRGQWGMLQVKEDKMSMTLEVSAVEDGNLETALVDMKYSESPARVHKVVDSIVNWDEKAKKYGKCEDEYYILAGKMLNGFPFETCIDITYLRVDFEKEQRGVTANYIMQGKIDETIKRYTNFLKDEGYVTETERDISDDADVVITVKDKKFELMIKLIKRDDGTVGVQLSYYE